MRINFNANVLNFASLDLAKKNMRAIRQDGYQKVDKINMINQDGEIVRGNVYIRDDGRNIDVISTDNNCARIGYLTARPDYDEYKGAYHCSINNYMNLHPDRPLLQGEKLKGYSGVGSKLYEALEEHIRKYHPNITRLHAYITNAGSWEFHTKQGFVGDESEFDIYGLCADNLMRKNIKK